MSMQMDLGIYEALTEIGVKADSARVVERKFEAAIDLRFESAKANLMTKEDGLRIEASILRMESSLCSAMQDQIKWTIGLMFTCSGIIIAAIKLL